MSDKQERFAEEYIIDLNATQAAIRAGYATKRAKEQGYQLLNNDGVQSLISTKRLEQQARTNITADRVLKAAAQITFSDIRDYYNEDGTLKNITELSDDAAMALASVEVDELFEMDGRTKVFTGYSKKVKLYDKLGGIEKLMKHLGLYKSDNDQSKPVINIPPVVNVYNSGPPLAPSEDDIDDRVQHVEGLAGE